MSILNYSNKACTGDNLSYRTPLNLRGLIIHQHRLNLKDSNKNYLAFNNADQFVDSGYFVLQLASANNIHTITSGEWCICSNLVKRNNYTISNYSWDFTNKKIKVIVNNDSNNTAKLYTWDFETTANLFSGPLIGIRLNSIGVPNLVIGTTNIKISNQQISDITNNIDQRYGFVGAYLDTSGTIHYSSALGTLVLSKGIKLFDEIKPIGYQGVNLLHYWPCSEGSDYYCYDTVGTAHAKLYGTSRNSAWIFKDYADAYNTVYGFKQDKNQSTTISKVKIPMNRDLILYKSCFTHSIDECNTTSKAVLSYRDNKLIFTPVKPNNNLGINTYGSTASKTSTGRHFRLKAKIKNNTEYTLRLQNIFFYSGMLLSTYGLGIASDYKNIAPGEEYICDIISRITNETPINIAAYTSYITFTLLNVPTDTLTDNTTQNIEFSDIEITQTDYIKEVPVIKDGKNASESSIYFTGQYSSNILPEVNQHIFLPPNPLEGTSQSSPNMGADIDGGWDITSKPEANVIKDTWRATKDFLYYLKNHDTNDLPEGISYGVDMKMSQPIGYGAASGFLTDMCKVNSSGGILTNPIWDNKWYKFKIHIHFWYKLKELATNGRLMAGILYDRAFEIWNNDIPDTNWHYFDKTVDFNIQTSTITSIWSTLVGISWIGWPSSTTQADSLADSSYYVGSIADFRYEITPNDYSYEPIYFKKDFENNSISNIVVYDWPQKGDNLKRVINWVNNRKEIELP